jgi:hypothetical protein
MHEEVDEEFNLKFDKVKLQETVYEAELVRASGNPGSSELTLVTYVDDFWTHMRKVIH